MMSTVGICPKILCWPRDVKKLIDWVHSEGVNTIHPEPEIHEHFMIQKATGHVHNLKHILTYIETTVTNCVNITTHTDEFTAQH